MHFLQLPAELWEFIAEFVLSNSLGQACRQLKAALGSRRYARLVCGSRTMAVRVAILKEKLRSLQLWPIDSWNPKIVSVLRGATNLHSLVIGSHCRAIGVDGMQRLGGLREVPSLHTLSLFLPCITDGQRGVNGLAALKDSPSLQCLTLDLTGVDQGAMLLIGRGGVCKPKNW